MLSEFIEVNLWVLLLVMTRVGTMISMVPGFSAGYITPRYRLGLALAFSFAVLPAVSRYVPPVPTSALEMFLILAGEVVIGAFMASVAIIIVSSLQVAGTFISYFASMANALVQDAVAEQQSSVISSFLSVTGIVIIFVTDLHHLMLRALVDSFELFRPGGVPMFGDMSNIVARHVAEAFLLGLKFSSPLLMVALIYYLALGVLGRLMPQLQVFFFGLPLQVTVQIWVLMITFSGIMLVFAENFAAAYRAFLAP